MHDDLEPCATEPNLTTSVKFLYDYNTQNKDLFQNHVGSVYLYLFDRKGTFISRHERTRNFTSDPQFEILFDSTEIKPGRTYQFLAVALGNHGGYNSSLSTPGFQRNHKLQPGVSTIQDYILELDTYSAGQSNIFNFASFYEDKDNQLLDTLWTTLNPQIVDIPTTAIPPESTIQEPDKLVEVTIPLMRITNHVEVALRSNSFNENTDVSKYNVVMHFPHGNNTLDITGVPQGERNLYYKALRKQMRPIADTKAGETETTQHEMWTEFGVSRFLLNDEATLEIWNEDYSKQLVKVEGISKLLAKGNEAYPDNWDDQEYLDREYDYYLTLGIGDVENPRVEWIEIKVNLLGWVKRMQWVDF